MHRTNRSHAQHKESSQSNQVTLLRPHDLLSGFIDPGVQSVRAAHKAASFPHSCSRFSSNNLTYWIRICRFCTSSLVIITSVILCLLWWHSCKYGAIRRSLSYFLYRVTGRMNFSTQALRAHYTTGPSCKSADVLSFYWSTGTCV